MAKSKKLGALTRFSSWYGRNERPISVLSLVGGFIFNVFTLTRVDNFLENFWVAAHLAVVAICIILINRQESGETEAAANPEKIHFWLVNVMQFFFGGLLSTFIVFYFRSAVIAVTWPFFVVLLIAFLANESLKRHYASTAFQISFFFLSLYLFLIFLLPVILHRIDSIVFLMSGGLSVLILIVFLSILKRFTKKGFQKGRHILVTSVLTIFLLVNGLYFLDLIPPLPLSLQDAGIFHSINRDGKGGYVVTYEESGFWQNLEKYVGFYPTYHTTAGEPAYAFSAIFSPIDFSVNIRHQWQYYNSAEKKWITSITIPLSVTGGRDSGYRTYSINTGLTTGKWRVNVTTNEGQIIGRMSFRVVVTPAPAVVIQGVK